MPRTPLPFKACKLAGWIVASSISIIGCAAPRTPVTLAQWSWGRNVDLSRDRSPDFERRAEQVEDEDVTVAEPEPPREPRRLFGFGGERSGSDSRDESSSTPWWRRSITDRSTTPSTTNESHAKTTDSSDEELYAEAERLVAEGRLSDAATILKPLTKSRRPMWKALQFWKVDPDLDYGYLVEPNNASGQVGVPLGRNQTKPGLASSSNNKPSARSARYYSRAREDALFLLAEIKFQQEQYTDAQGYYQALLKEYPSTRHLNGATKRLFHIGRTWLGMPEFATASDVTPVNLEDPSATPTPKKQKPPHSAILVPNLIDQTRPTFDTPGHALEALKAIWMYDPRGPLADDSIMMTASHYLRIGNYQEADRYFSMLREEYPNSPHLQTSFVLGSHVKLMSYQGAMYDEKQLEDARLLKESTLRLFPNLPDKDRLKDELQRIEEARAQRLWELVEFYRRKDKPKAQVIYAEELLQKYPKSQYAPQAREVLAEMQPDLLHKTASERSAPDRSNDADSARASANPNE